MRVDDWTTTRWTPEMVAAIGAEGRLPLLTPALPAPAVADLDLWDMWPIAERDGRTVVAAGRQGWFYLATPRDPEPEARHDRARIHLLSLDGATWQDHGPAFSDDLAPGSREWSGSAVLGDDGVTLTMFFTAAGDRAAGPHFRQRLFETTGRFVVTEGRASCRDWTPPVESVRPDPRWYAPAEQHSPVDGGIKGFRDPGIFRDPADGGEYLLYTASAAAGGRLDGVVGVARRDASGRWEALPPAIDATGTNAEMERPHIVLRDGRYYLFWSTQRRRFAPGLSAPTGLYGMVADRMAGPWRPLNGTGLVAGNPEAAPWQAYCWWVTGEGAVASFVDYPGSGDPHAADAGERRRRFGGTPAPFFHLRFDGNRVTVA